MQNAILFIFSAVFAAVLSGCGGGGGGGGSPSTETPRDVRYITWTTDPTESDFVEELNNLQSVIRESNPNVSLEASENSIPLSLSMESESENRLISSDVRHVIITGARAGDTYRYATSLFATALTVEGFDNTNIVPITVIYTVFEQEGTNYLAIRCDSYGTRALCDRERYADGNKIYSFDSQVDGDNANIEINTPDEIFAKEPVFTLPENEFTVEDVFLFNRGLIGDSYQYGNFHINYDRKHAEYRLTPFSDVFIDGGFRRFDNADFVYGRINLQHGGWRFQYTVGGVKSNYYREETVDGAAFGWQKDGFAVKAEKPVGKEQPNWLRVFWKTELQ